MIIDVHVETKILRDFDITQTVRTTMAGKTEVLWRSVIQTQNEHVRDALIKLGWIPPKD